MCTNLRALHQATVDVGRDFDARILTPTEALAASRLWARIEAVAAAAKALAAARSSDGDAWKAEGYRSAEDQFAADTGTTSGRAKEQLKTGRRMLDQPDVAGAALSGELSFERAALVADGAAADPSKTAELIEAATNGSHGELREKVARALAAAADVEKRRAEIHRNRALRRRRNVDGSFHTVLYGLFEDSIDLQRAIEPVARCLNAHRRRQGRPIDTFAALDYDALLLLADTALGKPGELTFDQLRQIGLFPQVIMVPPPAEDPSPAPRPAAPTPATTYGPPPIQAGPTLFDTAVPPDPMAKPRLAGVPDKTFLRVDVTALLDRYPADAPECTLAGQPVPAALVKDLLESGSRFIVGLLTKGEDILALRQFGRRPTAAQLSMLEWIYPTCAVAGCDRTIALQSDHREDWSKTHFTDSTLLDRLCHHHHNLKTRDNWALVAGTGKRAMVPPSDPRHPRRAKPVAPRARPSPAAHPDP